MDLIGFSYLKGIPPGATDIYLAVMARMHLLELAEKSPAGDELKKLLQSLAEQLSQFIVTKNGPAK